MKITNIDSFIEEFRNGRDIWSRASIELAVREIERLRKENNKLKVRLAASENDLVLFEVSEMLKKTQARVQELEAENSRLSVLLHDEMNQLELTIDLSNKRWIALNNIYTDGEKHNANWCKRKAQEGLGIK